MDKPGKGEFEMKNIKPSNNEQQWPRQAVNSIETRKQDLVVRITDWSKDKDEPAYDVEIYIGGVFDWNESKTCTKYEHGTMTAAKSDAIRFAQDQIVKLL